MNSKIILYLCAILLIGMAFNTSPPRYLVEKKVNCSIADSLSHQIDYKKDSIQFRIQLSESLCSIFEHEFKEGDSAVFSMTFNKQSKQIRLDSYAYNLFKDGVVILKQRSDYSPGFIGDSEKYKTSFHYRLFRSYKFRYSGNIPETDVIITTFIFLSR